MKALLPFAVLILAPTWCIAQSVGDRDLIIPAEGPGHVLTDIRSAHLDEKELLYVVQPGDGLVRVFDRTGRFVRDIGAPGEGPGEFRYPNHTGTHGNRVWITDLLQQRLHIFGRDGTYMESASMEHDPTVEGAEFMRMLPAGIASDGTLIVEANIPDRATIDAESNAAGFFRQEADRLRRLASFDVRSRAWRVALPGGQEFVSPNPIGRHTLHALRPDGSAIVLLDRFSTDQAPRIRIVDAQTGTESAFSLPHEPIEATSTLRRRLIDAQTERLAQFGIPGLSERQIRERVQNAMHFPSRLAPVTALIVSSNNTMWVQRFAPPEATTATWDAYAPDGAHRATLTLPVAARVVAANSEVVWTAEERDGFPILVRYRH